MKVVIKTAVLLLVSILIQACEPIEPAHKTLSGHLRAPLGDRFPEGASYELKMFDRSASDQTFIAMVDGTLSGGELQPFSLTYQPRSVSGNYRIDAAVYAANGLKLYVGQLSQINTDPLSVAMQKPTFLNSSAPIRTLVLECTDVTAVIRLGPGEAALFLPGSYTVLSQQRAASGAKYIEGDIALWLKGDEATLIISDHLQVCKNNRRKAIWEDAKLNGASFRAVGNEPGWVLLINHGRLDFSYDYGQSQLQVTMPEPVVDRVNGYSSYQFEYQGKSVVVNISMQSCSDSMSDETYESTVDITLAGRKFMGCGRALY